MDQHGVVLDILVHPPRNAGAAKLFFKRPPAGLEFKPRRVVTDGLRSFSMAQREILPEVRHRTSPYLNNGTENSHRPTRRRERQMQQFKSPDQAQRGAYSGTLSARLTAPRWCCRLRLARKSQMRGCEQLRKPALRLVQVVLELGDAVA
jgi:transposase-like protein